MTKLDYFVDEAGDTTLFGRYGKVLVDTDAVSRFFMVARLEVVDVDGLQADMQLLRSELLVDPLLKAIPSMQQCAGKTALFFHAKDDVPEVRHAVFKLLLRHDLRFSAVVKEKKHLLAEILQRKADDPAYRYKPDGHEIYDDLIARLFGGPGEFLAQRNITFAIRGSKPRTAALKAVLDHIDLESRRNSASERGGQTTVHSGYPSESAGLQACDYLLWALQRFYERKESRYMDAMWPAFVRVLDLDAAVPKTHDKQGVPGMEFNKKHPLSLKSRAGVWECGSRDIG